MKTEKPPKSPTAADSQRGEACPVPICSLFVIRGEINGSMTYVQKEGEEYVAKASSVKIYGATLFVHRGDAKNALDKMRHGTAVLMEIVELSPANVKRVHPYQRGRTSIMG